MVKKNELEKMKKWVGAEAQSLPMTINIKQGM
jgi:hypothetical protein